MKKFYIICGLFILFTVAVTAKTKVFQYLAQVDGKEVVVKLTKVAIAKSKHGSWVEFQYNGKTYSTKHIPWSEIEQYQEGDQIILKTYRDSEEFIPRGYSAKGELFAFAIATLVGFLCLYKGVKKKSYKS